MKKDLQLGQMNITFRAAPVFADRSITATQVASVPHKRDPKKAARKEGTVRVIFVDSVSNLVVADVVMTSIAAEQLAAGIQQSLGKLKTDLKDGSMPQREQPRDEQPYIG
ncbi:MAG: hypothetical protein HY520_00090 [Candidatus Aenigmarchaeota archaeon]|nr:hypothetical protein [Candidatus Aenigmarchaeota archaeon]